MILKNLGKIFFFVVFFQVVLLARFELEQTVSKSVIYLNETIKVTLTLSFENNTSDLIDLVDFEEYESVDFWTTLHTNQTKYLDGTRWIYRYEYLLEPKKSGSFILPEQLIKVSSYQIRKNKRYQKTYSNSLGIKVLPIVNDIPLQGDYNISFSVDKTSIKPNESIRGKLYITGKGNLKDIKKYDLKLHEQSVYSDELMVDSKFTNSSYEGNASQEFLIVSDTSFSIPSFTLEYYNPYNGEIELKQTKPIFIDVIADEVLKKDEVWVKYIFLLLGVILGIVFLQYYKNILQYFQKRKTPLYQNITKVKTKKELYNLLIKHNHNKKFHTVLEELEDDIYKEKNKQTLKYFKHSALKVLV